MAIEPETGIAADVELEVRLARLPFPGAQAALAGPSERRVAVPVPVAWHSTEAHPERGCFAVLRRGGPYEDLLGQTLLLAHRQRAVYVYAVNLGDVTADISISRRSFLALARLSHSSINCRVEVRG